MQQAGNFLQELWHSILLELPHWLTAVAVIACKGAQNCQNPTLRAVENTVQSPKGCSISNTQKHSGTQDQRAELITQHLR